MRATTPHPPPATTHYCQWDAPGRRVVRALCGVLIKRTEHRNDPTCTTCQAAIDQRERRDA